MLYGNSFFTTINLLKGYHQIEVEETSRICNTCQTLPIHFFTFWTNQCPCILPTFTGTCPSILYRQVRNLVHRWYCYIQQYIRSHVTQVMQTLKAAHLKVKINKFWFAKNSVMFLDHLITPSGVWPNAKNREAVTSFPISTKLKDMHAFLDLCNCYQRFTKNYSVPAGPLPPCWYTQTFTSCLRCIPALVEIVLVLTSLKYWLGRSNC